MNFPATLKYTKDHEWILLEGNTATIGITDFAQHELGDIVYVDINTVGKTLASEEIFGTVACTVLSINPLLEKQPELVNSDPYGDGWMIKMEVSNIEDVAALMSHEAYGSLVG